MLRTAVLLAAAIGAAAAQPLTFEVASVKPNLTDSGHSSNHTRPTSLIMDNSTLAGLIRSAYGLRPDQLIGPGWMETERFDIAAKSSHEVTDDELMQMLQALLVERFKLTFHHDEKELPVYALVVDKKGLKIQPVEGNGDSTHTEKGLLQAKEVTLAQLAKSLSTILGRTVLDDTKTEGSFTFELKWTPEDLSAKEKKAEKESAGPSIYDAVREQLGLKFEERKAKLPILIVDHVERVPTEN